MSAEEVRAKTERMLRESLREQGAEHLFEEYAAEFIDPKTGLFRYRPGEEFFGGGGKKPGGVT